MHAGAWPRWPPLPNALPCLAACKFASCLIDSDGKPAYMHVCSPYLALTLTMFGLIYCPAAPVLLLRLQLWDAMWSALACPCSTTPWSTSWRSTAWTARATCPSPPASSRSWTCTLCEPQAKPGRAKPHTLLARSTQHCIMQHKPHKQNCLPALMHACTAEGAPVWQWQRLPHAAGYAYGRAGLMAHVRHACVPRAVPTQPARARCWARGRTP